MATLAELFVLLDGWEDRTFSQEMHLEPDPALETARSALASGIGFEEALAAVEQQIAVVAPALRAARYDLIAAAPGSGREPDADLLRHMLCDLHLAAFQIRHRQGALEEARAHLVRATATESGDNTPKLYFVELYVELGQFAAAVATLGAAMTGDTFGSFSMLELGVDLLSQGALPDAQSAFERAADLDPAGLVTSVCRVRSEGRKRADVDQPTTAELQMAFSSAGRALDEGRDQAALDGFVHLVAHDPRSARAWLGVGCAYRDRVEREEAARPGDAADHVAAVADRGRETVTEDAHTRIAYAAEAFRLALALDPAMWPAGDALVWAELWLDRPDQALESALRSARGEPGNPHVLATLGWALLINGILDEAEEAATAALEGMPDNLVAHETLATVRELARDRATQ